MTRYLDIACRSLVWIKENPWLLAGHILTQITNWACRFMYVCMNHVWNWLRPLLKWMMSLVLRRQWREWCLLCFGANEVNDVTCASAPMKRMMSLVLRRQWSEWCHLCFGANEENDVSCASAPMKWICHLGLGHDMENDVFRLWQFPFYFRAI